MKIEIYDPDALKRITPKALQKYIENKRYWVKTGTYGEYSDVYESDCDFDITEIVVPRTDIIADYARVVKTLLTIFAEIEDVDQITMYNTLLRLDKSIQPTKYDIKTLLGDGMKISDVGECGWIRIETEFMDRHNDCISIYARYFNDKGNWDVHDDGDTIQELEMSGINIPEKTFQRILKDYRIEQDNLNTLICRPDNQEFTVRVYNLLQAMILLLNWKPDETERKQSKWLGL